MNLSILTATLLELTPRSLPDVAIEESLYFVREIDCPNIHQLAAIHSMPRAARLQFRGRGEANPS
jgi:hypothetical protein